MVRRVIACLVLGSAFVVMASVFSPDRSKAGDVSVSADDPTNDSADAKSAGPRGRTSIDSDSTNPHEGLRSLGTLESGGYTVHIYSTAVGPRYSVYESGTSRELGSLLTAEQVNQLLPELQLPALDFSAPSNSDSPGALMLSDPDIMN